MEEILDRGREEAPGPPADSSEQVGGQAEDRSGLRTASEAAAVVSAGVLVGGGAGMLAGVALGDGRRGGGGRSPSPPRGRIRCSGGPRAEAVVAQGARWVNEEGPVRIPKDVFEELESVRLYAPSEVLDIPALRYVAMERDKPALVMWIDEHAPEYGRGLLDGFQAEE